MSGWALIALFASADAERVFEESQRRRGKWIRAHGRAGDFGNLAFVDVIEALPALRLVNIDVGDRALCQQIVRQERFEI